MCVYVCVFMCMCVHACLYMHACVCMCVCVHMCVCVSKIFYDLHDTLYFFYLSIHTVVKIIHTFSDLMTFVHGDLFHTYVLSPTMPRFLYSNYMTGKVYFIQ